MESEESKRPSEVTDIDHIWARSPATGIAEHRGKWIIMPLNSTYKDLDGNTQLDRVWFEVKKLSEKGVLYDSRCSTALFTPQNQTPGIITCFTPDYTDVKDVRRVANIIREAVNFDNDIHYKTDDATKMGKYGCSGTRNVALYKHTPDSILYRKEQNMWLLVTDHAMELEADASCENNNQRPSKVINEEYLWARKPGGYHHNEEEGGKWLIYLDKKPINNQGDTILDKAWHSITTLVHKGILYDCRCTTNFSDPYISDGIGVITCYTPNFINKDDVKRVAEAITANVSLTMPLYYNIIDYTILGLDNDEESWNESSIYKFDMKGNMFCREEQDWKLLQQSITVIPPCAELKTSSVIPSEVKDKGYIWTVNKEDPPYTNTGKGGKWIVTFRNQAKNDEGTTTADRAWVLVQELVSQGKLHDSKCSTARLNTNEFVIICYTPDYTDVKELWDVANTIRSRIRFEEDMYYKLDSTIYDGEHRIGKNAVIYKHSQNCRLYKKLKARCWREIPKHTVEFNPERPSEVKDKDYVWAVNKSAPRYVDVGTGGKWIIYFNDLTKDEEGATKADRAWFQVQQLVSRGELHDSKCSTAKKSNTAAIICYTPDFADIKEVWHVADTIRAGVDYKNDIYYKTDMASREGKYYSEGECKVSFYKHTPRCILYRKENDLWKQIPVHMMHPTTSGQEQFQRPSEVTYKMWLYANREDIPPRIIDGKGGRWRIYLDNNNKDEQGDTLLDKVWHKVEMLVKEAQIYDSCCSTATPNPLVAVNNGLIICCTPDHSDIDDIKRVALTVAKAVRSIVTLKPFYYRTDCATHRWGFLRDNSQIVSRYKFEPETGVMMENIGSQTWEEVGIKETEHCRNWKFNLLKPPNLNQEFRPQGWGKLLNKSRIPHF